METERQMVSYEDTEEAEGLEEYYGKVEDEIAPQESNSVTETPKSVEEGDYSDLKENRKDRHKKHSRSHHRSRNHKKLKNHDHSNEQEQKQSKKAKKEEQVLQDQTVQKNSPKLGEPFIGEDGEILEDGEIADDQEGALKDDDEGEVEEDWDEDLEKDKEESKDNNEADTGDRHHKKDKRKHKRDRHRDQATKRRRSKEENDKEKQKKKKRHHNYKDYDKVEDDYSQIWMPLKEDNDRHCDRSPLSPYNSPDEDQEFGSLSRGDPGDRDQRRRMSGDRSEWRFNNSQGNRNRGRGGRNNRGRDRERRRDRDRGDRDKDCGGRKRRNSGEGYRSPPGPYDSPSDEDYDEDSRGSRKPKIMTSMVEEEYLDPSMTTNENEVNSAPTSVNKMYGSDMRFGSGIIPQALHHDNEGGNYMRNFGDTPDSQERYGDSFGNGAKPTDESPRGRKLLIDYSHGRRASEGEVQYTRKWENSFERDRVNSENLYGSFQRDRGNGNQQDASLEGHINYGKDLDDAVNRDIFTQKRKNPFEQESDCIKKLKELSQSDLVCQKKPFNLFGQGMEYKPISDGPVKRDRAYRKRKKIVERDNRYKKACDRSFKKRRNFVQEHKGNKIKNKAGHKISDESEREVENKARLMSQRRLKLYLKELQQLKSIEKDLKGKHYVEEQTINENKALQEELQKEINKLRGHQSQINDALPDPFENGKKKVKSKDHSIEGMGNGQFKENFFLHGQFASQDGTTRFLSDSVMMKHGLAKNETPVMKNEIMDDRKVLASPVIEHSDIMPCNDIELNKDIKQMLFDKLTLKPMQSRREFLKLQWQDPSLADIRREFELGNGALSRGGNKITKFIEKDTLIHKVILEGDKYSYQLVVPTSLREDVMQLAHTSSAEGHLSRRKTLLRIQKEFHWPDVNTDVRMFCRYCMICNSLLRNETKMGHSDTNSSEDGEESISNSEVDQEDKNVFLKNSLFSNCGLFSLEEFAEAQLNDPKFHPILWDVENGIERVRAGKKKGTVKFVKEQNLIFRQYTENDKVYHQLVVPHIYRKQLIKMAHESSGTQHLNKMQTRLKMLREFYWQELRIDVKLVCDSCGVCNMKLSDTIGVKDQMLYDPNDRKRKFQKEKFKEQEIKHDGLKTQDELAEKEPLVDLLFSKCSREDFKEALIKDADLNDIRHGAESGQDVTIFGLSHKFIKKEDLIYRQATNWGKASYQLVVPSSFREQVKEIAHVSPNGSHFSKTQTRKRLRFEFFWPGSAFGAYKISQSCSTCQSKIPEISREEKNRREKKRKLRDAALKLLAL